MIDRRTLVTSAGLMLALPAAASAPVGRGDSLALVDGRVVPLRVWLPLGKARALVAFSHGANSRPDRYDRLCERLAAAGCRVVAPLHADSPDHPGGGAIPRERGVPMRLADMRAVLAEHGKGLPAVAAGHSYGALIAQMLGGAGGETPEAVRAVVAWSPPGPFPPAITAESWKAMARPQLVVTGTADTLPMMAPTWDVHRVSFDVAPGPAALFVGAGVDHYFGNIICRPERREPPQTAQFDDAVAVTLGFLDHVLAGQSLAGQSLAGQSLAGPNVAGLARAARPGQSWVEVKA